MVNIINIIKSIYFLITIMSVYFIIKLCLLVYKDYRLMDWVWKTIFSIMLLTWVVLLIWSFGKWT